MKTPKMIIKLIDNPNRKVRCVVGNRKDDVLGIDGKGHIDWFNEQYQQFEETYFSIQYTLDWEWELVPDPVDFMVAVNSSKMIRPNIGTFAYAYPHEWIECFAHGNYLAGESWISYINGKWLIKEEGS